ncbi:secondary thiamine-phosphate synthase enzyme YjbQ [Leptolyngbya sp. FACHB-261]|uniref:secondary thiamine-phosphate synthase enzyme YjbQ n=1 Tax=Leptolyngbya sp. FACHB-261 TaxID=2692806 RepID=UPI001689856D|nr:secondary thiamine-phosphate synthase enzyme YjbQ [Leptolyngbya sp. FACHB-261]MBD2099937.1 YjbQ family protein [Leptolyngbya sp. FACHB-261]
MSHHQQVLQIRTSGKCLHNITAQVREVVERSGIQMGLCTVFLRHTSASLIIQENADPDVLGDLERFMAKLVPEDNRLYEHTAEGSDDMPAHIRSVLTHTSENIPVVQGRLGLGTWQGLYVWEHRRRPHQREVIVHVSGEPLNETDTAKHSVSQQARL